MPKSNPFKHLHQDNDESDETESLGSRIVAKRVTLGIFVLFLLLFPHYAPWEPSYTQSDTLIQKIFTLYFFVANQTLGIVHEGGAWRLPYLALSGVSYNGKWNDLSSTLPRFNWLLLL